MQDIEKQVVAIISEHLGIKTEEVTPEKSVSDDLGADLIDLVEIIMTIEDRFGVAISEDEAEGLTTVSKMVEFIEKREEESRALED